MVFSLRDLLTNIALQPIPGLMLLTEFCLNPNLFCFIIHTTLWSVPLVNSLPIFTPPYPTIALASNIYTILASSPSPEIPFFPTTYQYQILTADHTLNLYFSIFGIRIPSQHSKPTRIHSNTISKLIPRHHYDRNTSAFR